MRFTRACACHTPVASGTNPPPTTYFVYTLYRHIQPSFVATYVDTEVLESRTASWAEERFQTTNVAHVIAPYLESSCLNQSPRPHPLPDGELVP